MADDFLIRLRAMAACAMLGCVIAGSFGHHEDDIQWAAVVAGSWIGGLLRLERRTDAQADH